MVMKRGPSPELVDNPFIKKRNLEWSLELSGSIHDSDQSSSSNEPDEQELRPEEDGPHASAVEAGKAKIEDHLDYFAELLTKTALSPFPLGTPRLSIEGYRKLYKTNSDNPRGAHFIIHQHDHPIAGTHYDLRLQINETSSASWAIMYGPPGDPNSQRLNRNATETRIHCLWNHLIETASPSTGSLLIWDTGTYTILSGRESSKEGDSTSQSESDEQSSPELTEQAKLHWAFQARKIRIRLHGTRLPHNYVLNLRLTKDEDAAGRAKSSRAPARRRRRGGGPTRARGTGRGRERETSSDSDDDRSEIVSAPAQEADSADVSATEKEIRELEDEEVRRTNAYPGAANSIGSVHQRRWYLLHDRAACGFARRRKAGKVVWELESDAANTREDTGDRLAFPFYVRGVEAERSVVTGRLGAEVLRDEGVVGYVGRKGWRPVLK
ncbi:DNA polymerase ligase-domain-containing protein [Hypoxylon cercidicola]|nr:DNA polymerase ligase-domain-containing protein [Hypoxylon cercidicola]